MLLPLPAGEVLRLLTASGRLADEGHPPLAGHVVPGEAVSEGVVEDGQAVFVAAGVIRLAVTERAGPGPALEAAVAHRLTQTPVEVIVAPGARGPDAVHL